MGDELIESTGNSFNLPDNKHNSLQIHNDTKGINFQDALSSLVCYADLTGIINSIEPKSQYIVDIPIEYEEELRQGLVEINKNKISGKMWPTLVKILPSGKKKIVANLPIREESLIQGNPMHDLSTGMQLAKIQGQIAELTQLVKDTYEAVLRIEEGQRDDRVGLLKSGYEGVQLALLHKGEQRQRELELAREQIREAKNRIGEVLQTRLKAFQALSKYQVMRFGRLVWDNQYYRKKDAEYHRVQDYYDLYCQSVELLASSYLLVGDISASILVLNNAKEFISSLDFSRISTIVYAHKRTNRSDFFFTAPQYSIDYAEKSFIEQAKPYDLIEIFFTGNNLLGVIKNEKERDGESKTQ